MRRIALAAAMGMVVVLAGCAPALDPRDVAALERLAEVAGPTSGVDPDLIERTECWLPSAHPIKDDPNSDTSWRVLCRVHWHERDTGAPRYQDTTCIGDFGTVPVLDRCYRWTYYDLMPAYEDEDGVNAG